MRSLLPRCLFIVASGYFAAAMPGSALSQPYPSKPIRMVTQFGIGAPGDLLVRTVASYMAEYMGQPVVVDNRTGAAGIIAARVGASAAPDGYTIIALSAGVPVIQAVLGKQLLFDPVRDLTPVTGVGDTASLIVAHPSVADSLTELLAKAKAQPGKLFYGTTGIGSQHHLAGEEINMLAGVSIVHIPYKVSPIMDTASGALPLTYVIASQGLPQVTAGKVKALAVVGNSRLQQLPSVPAVDEVVAGFEPPPGWTGLFVPAGMPASLLQRVHADAVKAITSTECTSKIIALAHEPIPSKSPEEFSALVKRQIALVSRIVSSAGIKAAE
jgi:tripartite-type tricarboxylate transporter receptor subunit TctC